MSKIQEYFADKTVLITGATGFLGKALVEKMLRSLPELRRIYLLIRPKGRGARLKSAQHRFRNEIAKSTIFDHFRQELGGEFDEYLQERVVPIEGDLIEDRLGLGDEDYARLCRDVELMINSAASVEFDERLDHAINLNTLGPRRTMAFANDCKRLEAFVHISTCYVNGKARGWAPEEIQQLTFDPHAEIDRLQKACARVAKRHGDQSRVTAQKLVELGLQQARKHGWHDTYTFTKALGEQMIVQNHGKIPTVILRPSIIESTLNEPVGGWIDSLRVADPLFIGYGQGTLQDFPALPETICDMIPCDQVVNAILAAAPRIATEGGLQVYQVATGEQNPITVRHMHDIASDYFRKFPMQARDGSYVAPPEWTWPDVASYRRKLSWLYRRPLEAAIKTLKPLSVMASVQEWQQRLTRRRAAIDRLLYYVDIYSPYARIEARFATKNTAALWRWLSKEDHRLFDFDPAKIDWRSYLAKTHIPGLKRNVLRLPPDPATPRVVDPSNYWVRTNKSEQMIRRITRKVMKITAHAYFKLEVEGRENLPRGAFIVAANHCSHIDTGVVVTAFGDRGGELFIMGARDYFFDYKAKGWFFHTFLNVVPFDRSANMVEGLRLARSVLRSNHPVLIFPEGTRSHSGNIQPFRAGIGWLGVEMNVPIVPCFIDGTHSALPKGEAIPKRAKTRVVFGKPVSMEAYRTDGMSHQEKRELYRHVAEDVRKLVEALGGKRTQHATRPTRRGKMALAH